MARPWPSWPTAMSSCAAWTRRLRRSVSPRRPSASATSPGASMARGCTSSRTPPDRMTSWRPWSRERAARSASSRSLRRSRRRPRESPPNPRQRPRPARSRPNRRSPRAIRRPRRARRRTSPGRRMAARRPQVRRPTLASIPLAGPRPSPSRSAPWSAAMAPSASLRRAPTARRSRSVEAATWCCSIAPPAASASSVRAGTRRSSGDGARTPAGSPSARMTVTSTVTCGSLPPTAPRHP